MRGVKNVIAPSDQFGAVVQASAAFVDLFNRLWPCPNRSQLTSTFPPRQFQVVMDGIVGSGGSVGVVGLADFGDHGMRSMAPFVSSTYAKLSWSATGRPSTCS